LVATGLTAADKKSKQAQALIAGTVFRDTGFTLAGAEIILVPLGDSKDARNTKKMQAISDGRGEFALRVPALPSQYKLSVRAPGYKPQEKTVTIAADERLDVFFRLEPASKK